MKKTIAIVSVLVVVFLCSSFTVSASTLPVFGRATGEVKFLNDTVVIFASSRALAANVIDYDFDYDSSRAYYGSSTSPYPVYSMQTSTTSDAYTYEQQILFSVNLRNSGDYLAYADADNIGVLPNFTFNYQPDGYWIEMLSDDFVLNNVTAGGELRFRPANQIYSYKGRVGAPKDTNITFSFIIHFLYTSSHYGIGSAYVPPTNVSDAPTYSMNTSYVVVDSISINSPLSFTSTNVTSSSNEVVNWWRIDQWLEIISHKIPDSNQAYIDNRQDSIDVNTNSSSAQTQSETNHQTELSYFNQTNTALSNSGISNYQFDNEQIGGIGSVSNDFTSVWNSLGSWTSVYIFSLTLSLGLAIIRHVRPIKRSNEE